MVDADARVNGEMESVDLLQGLNHEQQAAPPASAEVTSTSLLSTFLQLSSQEVQQLHIDLLPSSIPPSPSDSAASASLWDEDAEAVTKRRLSLQQTTPPSPSTPSTPDPSAAPSSSSSSLLSPDALSSASYTYQQLCHDQPLLHSDGVTTLLSGLRRHIQAGVLPSDFFTLHLPFLYHLLHQCAAISTVPNTHPPSPSPTPAADDRDAALLSLYSTVMVSFFPLLLTSPLPSLGAFLSCIPPSLPSAISSLLSYQAALHSSVPAPLLEDEPFSPSSPLSPDSASFTFDADPLSDDDSAPTPTVSNPESLEPLSLDHRLLQLIALWHPPWMAKDGDGQQLAATLLRVLALADAHEQLFQDTTGVRRGVAAVLSHLLTVRPALIPHYLPPLLWDVLQVRQLASAMTAAAGEAVDAASQSALFLLAHLCSSSLLLPASPSSVFLVRLLRLNLPFVAAHLRWAVGVEAEAEGQQWGSVVNSVCMLLEFYLSRHEGKARVDVGEELIEAQLLSTLVASLPVFHSTLVLACALSTAASRLCWQAGKWREAMERGDSGLQAALAPVWMALRGVGEEAAVEPAKAREERKEGDKSRQRQVKKKKPLLAVAALDEAEGEDLSAALPPLSSAPLPSPMIPVLRRGNEALRVAIDAAFSAASSAASSEALAFLSSLVSSVEAAASVSPSLSALLRPVLKGSQLEVPEEGDLDVALRQWGALIREVRKMAVERLQAVELPSLSATSSGDSAHPTAAPHSDEDEVEETQGDAERRAAVKSQVQASRGREQRRALLQQLAHSSKRLLSEGAKKD